MEALIYSDNTFYFLELKEIKIGGTVGAAYIVVQTFYHESPLVFL